MAMTNGVTVGRGTSKGNILAKMVVTPMIIIVSGKEMTAKQIHTTHLLLARLERLSADSHYAHRASGLRGSLLHYLEQVEEYRQTGAPVSIPSSQVEDLLSFGFKILEKAAREIRPRRR